MATLEEQRGTRPSAAPAPVGGPRTVGEAVGRYWWLPVLFAILGTLGGLALSYARDPLYTAEAALTAGRLDVQAQAVPGYQQATQSLADAYSRVVESDRVLVPVARETGRSVGSLADDVTATPVPESSVFRIKVTTTGERDAVEIANAATRRIDAYARRQTSRGPDRSVLEEFAKARTEASQLSTQVAAARRALAPRSRVERLKRRQSAAELEAQALQQTYVNQTTQAQGAAAVTILGFARDAESDRTKSLQIGGFGGLIAGLLLGGALAALLGARRRRLADSLLSTRR